MYDFKTVNERVLSIKDNYTIDTRLFCEYLTSTNQQFSVDALINWGKALAKQGYAAATVNRRLSAIRSRLRTLFEESGEASYNVLEQFNSERDLKKVHGMKISSRAVDPGKVFSADDVKKVIAVCPKRVGLIVEFLFVSGCRISEALNVRKTDLRRSRDSVSVRIVGKGSKERIVRIPVGLSLRIGAVINGKHYLFETEEGEQYSREYVARRVKSASLKALGRRMTPHCLRHSFATETIERTGKIKGVSKYLGHASSTTTMDMYNQEQLDFIEVPKL